MTTTTTKRKRSYCKNFRFTNRDKLGIIRDILQRLSDHDGDPYLRTGSKVVVTRINKDQSIGIAIYL